MIRILSAKKLDVHPYTGQNQKTNLETLNPARLQGGMTTCGRWCLWRMMELLDLLVSADTR